MRADRTSPYSSADRCLLDQARAAGCVLPAFTPESDPAAWREWDHAVSKAIALSRLSEGCTRLLASYRVAADALAGHPVEGPVPMFAVPADPFAISALGWPT